MIDRSPTDDDDDVRADLLRRHEALGEDLADGPHLGTEPASGSSTEAT